MQDTNENQYNYYRSGFGKSSIPFALVLINGQEISKKHQVSVDIRQKMLKHTEYTLKIPSEAFKDTNSYPMANSKNLLGADITIEFLQHGETTSLYTGQVTGVEYQRANKYPFIIISGKSYSVQIDSFAANRSYQNKTLEDILNEVKKEYTGSNIDFIISPEKKDIIPYTVSYNETAFEFIQRLARRYGEYFFWNGSQLIFGRGNQYTTELKEGRDFLEYRIKAYTQSQHIIYENYNPLSAEGQTVKSSDIPKSTFDYLANPFQDKAVKVSRKIYPEPKHSFYYDALSEEDEHRQKQKIKAHQDALQNLTTIESQTTSPRLRLGDFVKMLASISKIDIQSFRENGVPIESYLIQEISIQYDTTGYRNSFKAIPAEQLTAPYWDINAYPKTPDQIAVVASHDDPLQQNRVKLKFPWQKNGQTTPWVRLLQGYAGQDRGMHVIPEQGEEVLVVFRGGNAEVPLVAGSLYNGKSKSGFHTPDNRFKAFKTKDGEQLIMEGLKKILLSDAKGNSFEVDIEKDTITIKALEIINLLAQQINIKAEQDVNITAGHNMNTHVSNNYEIDTGRNTTIASGRNTYVSARSDMDIQGGRKIIGYSGGITEFGAATQMHIHGADSKITAMNKIYYKSPGMERLPQQEEFLYGKEKQIVEISVMDENFEKELDESCFNEKVNVLVYTRNYEEGEEVTIVMRQKKPDRKHTLTGIVDKEGVAKIENVMFKKNEIRQEEVSEQENIDIEDENKVYKKNYKGKDYTEEQWNEFEQKQWENYQRKKKNKGFFDWF